MGREHVPSRYRSFARKVRSNKGEFGQLMVEARTLRDPYYISQALMDIAVKANDAKCARSAILTSTKVRRDWQRAELLVHLSRKISGWDNPDEKGSLWNDLTSIIKEMDSGKGLSDAINGCVPRAPIEQMNLFFRRAQNNRGFERDDTRAVLRQWASLKDEEGLKRLSNDILKMKDSPGKVRLLGYLRIQLERNGVPEANDLLTPALTSSTSLGDEALESLRYIINGARAEDVETINNILKDIDDPNTRIRSRMTLAGLSERTGNKARSDELLDMSGEDMETIGDPALKHSLKQHLAQALMKGGREEDGKAVLAATMSDRGSPERLERSRELTHTGSRRHVLALFDGYEGGIKTGHTRAVARAAPLCMAYDLDLALLGFPINDLQDLIKKVRTDTNVGKGGQYLDMLMGENRIKLIPCTWKDPPISFPAIPVATTSRPDEKKTTLPKGKALCMIIGLGKRGLPPSLISNARYHLELTGKNIPLETCTAMGAIADRLKSIT